MPSAVVPVDAELTGISKNASRGLICLTLAMYVSADRRMSQGIQQRHQALGFSTKQQHWTLRQEEEWLAMQTAGHAW